MNKLIDTDKATITVNGKRIDANKFTDINKYTDVRYNISKRVAEKIKRKANWEKMQKKYKGE